MCIYPSDVWKAAEQEQAFLLMVEGNPKIIIGALGMDPKLFIEEAVIEDWKERRIIKAIKMMLVSVDLRDGKYDLEVSKIMESVPEAIKVRKSRKIKTFDTRSEKYNVGVN